MLVSSFVQRVDEIWLRHWFEQVGPVAGVRILRDRRGVSRGQAYVEFENLADLPKALLLHGQLMCTNHEACTCSGFPISVQRSGAEANYAKAAEDEGIKRVRVNDVYIGSLPTSITDVRCLATVSPMVSPMMPCLMN